MLLRFRGSMSRSLSRCSRALLSFRGLDPQADAEAHDTMPSQQARTGRVSSSLASRRQVSRNTAPSCISLAHLDQIVPGFPAPDSKHLAINDIAFVVDSINLLDKCTAGQSQAG